MRRTSHKEDVPTIAKRLVCGARQHIDGGLSAAGVSFTENPFSKVRLAGMLKFDMIISVDTT